MPALRFQAALTMSWSFPRAREENDHHKANAALTAVLPARRRRR
jgi:hypothetical protein